MLPPRALAVVKLMVHVVVAATCLAMTYASYRLIADDIGQRTAAAEIPLAWIYVVPMVGFALTALRAGPGHRPAGRPRDRRTREEPRR